MSTQPPRPPSDDEPSAGADATREIARPELSGQSDPGLADQGTSPWARPAGQTEPYGQPTTGYPPNHPASYPAAPEPEPRFAGQPSLYQPTDYPPSTSPPPVPYGQPFTSPYGQPPTGPATGTPWQAPDSGFAPPSPGAWPPVMAPQPPSRRRGLWVLVTLLVLALVAGTVTTVAVSSDSKKSSGASPVPTTNPSAPGPSASAPASPSPSPSLPPTGLIPTPQALLAIGYHAYSLRFLAQSEVSLGAGEDVQFKKYGLSRLVGLRALTLGSSGRDDDDWDASINILRFRDAASAKAELAYSNAQNLKAKDAKLIALSGLPTATGFLNSDQTDGLSVGAFTTVGRYQVVVILGGLAPNVASNAKLVAAEAARVMKAILPFAATIVPDTSGGTTPEAPTLPTPSPTGTRA